MIFIRMLNYVKTVIDKVMFSYTYDFLVQLELHFRELKFSIFFTIDHEKPTSIEFNFYSKIRFRHEVIIGSSRTDILNNLGIFSNFKFKNNYSI